MSRTAIAILSTENLLHNIRVIKNKTHNSKIIAMVKANAYGHGLRSVSLRIAKHVDMLGVASIDEAMALRKININTPILLAEGVFEQSELLLAAVEGFHVVFHEDIQLRWLDNLSSSLPINAWLKVNTGMGRLGFDVDKAKQAYDKLYNNPQVARPIRIMSHLACADEIDHPLNHKQLSQFKHIIKGMDSEYSICNSAGIWNYKDHHYHFVRPGIAIYGASPLNGVSASSLDLKPVMTLQTSLIGVRNMKKGESIGYGARYVCPEDMLVGVIAFGYGDGYPRTAKDGTPILVNNKKCQLIGRISMDIITVDLRNCKDAKFGDPVILWGEKLPIEEVASFTENISYDLLTGVQNRVKFYWTQHPEHRLESL
jgi:alanine racemase